MTLPVFFDRRQLLHRPVHEWTKGEKIAHPETLDRAETIVETIEADSNFFSIYQPQEIPLSLIQNVHVPGMLMLYETAQRVIAEGESFYPSVFPKRSASLVDPTDIRQAGYFCFDSGTPLTFNTWEAARLSASCAHEAALYVESAKGRVAYALCRPPGHHASHDLFGGYCYVNNAAVIAKRVRKKCRVAILDIDFHHGNGTQDIFYRDDAVLVVSVHGNPKEFYPFFSGYETEKGEGRGKGFNLNIPLPRGCDGQEYMRQMRLKVLPFIQSFDPGLLIVSAGFDTYQDDPIGAFALETGDYAELGEIIGKLNISTIILQEGGYHVQKLGLNVTTFLRGFR
ncbi:MAG: histone deacetylase family protein [Bdellovibrionia bacterium]